MNKNNLPFVSVIVPVYNAENYIRNCVDSLIEQTYPDDRYEIIFADNGSSDSTVTILNNYPVKVVVESDIQGAAAARNKGIKESKGEVLAFTDDDVVADRKWLSNGIKHLLEENKKGSKSVILGRAIPLKKGNLNVFAKYDIITSFDYRNNFKSWNFFLTKEAMEDIGYFNSELIAAEDTEWGERAKASDYRIEYYEDVIIFHPVRDSFKQLLKKQYRIGTGIEYNKNKKHIFAKIFYEIKKITLMNFFVIKLLLKAMHKNRIVIFDFFKLVPVVFIFSFATSLGRMKQFKK